MDATSQAANTAAPTSPGPAAGSIDPAPRSDRSTQSHGVATSAASISLQHVHKRYPDGTVAVDELSLHIRAGELAVLIGPSGCGKSTVLRMVNRLIEPTSGRILLDDEDVTAVDPVRLRRRIGYVIQNVGLFPHQSVEANVGTVPRLLGWPRTKIQSRTDELLELVGLDPGRYARRYPHELSGGQQQRVGVARALAADPVVLLMDEPFSAVDPIARARLQEEFLRLQAQVRKTIVLVTHDLDEAVRMADRIAVLSQGGKREQFAEPAEVLGQPATPFVREFVGAERGIRRLAVLPIERDLLQPLPDRQDTRALPAVPLDASRYDALAAMLAAGSDHVRVTDDEGEAAGVISRRQVLDVGHVGRADQTLS